MVITPERTDITERLCALTAVSSGQDPIGNASNVLRVLAIETPTPWGDEIRTANPEGSARQRIRAVQLDYFEKLKETGEYEERLVRGYPALFGIAPDAEWSSKERTRVLISLRGQGQVSAFATSEYFFEPDSPHIVDIVRAYFMEPDALPQFDQFLSNEPPQREFYVCTHGQVDICCAKFGVPLYRQARALSPSVRAWRSTHFGGHRFAPTAWEMPSGYQWAFLEGANAERVVNRDGETRDILTNLRGWTGVPNQVQPLEREGLRRFGWRWLDYSRTGSILEADLEAKRWKVRLEYTSPEGETGAFEGVTLIRRHIKDMGCGLNWGNEHEFPEYGLEAFRAG